MNIARSISDLPPKAAVYALYGGTGKSAYVAYVGVTGNLKNRIAQHLIRRDSSITSGTTATTLNPDCVTEVRWWRNGSFRKKAYREAAEMVALRVLDPTLRSRGLTTGRARSLVTNSELNNELESLFNGDPEGLLIIPNLQEALDRITHLEAKVTELESKLKK
jgi:predicted GIY-YIG superfamily endonuclease